MRTFQTCHNQFSRNVNKHTRNHVFCSVFVLSLLKTSTVLLNCLLIFCLFVSVERRIIWMISSLNTMLMRNFCLERSKVCILWFYFTWDWFFCFWFIKFLVFRIFVYSSIAEGVLVAASHPVITSGATASVGLLVLKSKICFMFSTFIKYCVLTII